MKLPNPTPRPEGEFEHLESVWQAPGGWRRFSAVNNSIVGLYYIGTSLLFLALAGVLGLVIRMQLAIPENTLLDHATYNQVFTMHGTVMMFLFAMPVIEAMAVYLLPAMLGARDLPFPHLSAYAFWAYALGGLAFFCTLFFGVAPDGGWFMYVPLTGRQYSPAINADFWLLGIGFIEISAIAGAIELIVGILRTRAPGMTLGIMPIYAWAMLAVAGMIVLAMPAVMVGTYLLELERALGWPIFSPERGGDPLLWQHLFWFFGHPEVYIIFLPAAGMISMMLPTMAQTALAGYRLVVIALLSLACFSFLLWAHHMFAAGLSLSSMVVFSAASMLVAIPSGMQVFAWIATLRKGQLRFHVPSLFILGFLFIFVLGGLTGVMVGLLPFDWQVHDTYFVVAHFHYVLIGGMVFPLFAGFYYWFPTISGEPLSERLGRWVFGLMFVGFNIAFFPMHITGLFGMPRRIYTYAAGLGWDGLNLTSTIGAFILASGFLLFFVDVIRRFRWTGKVDVNPWNAGTLEWLILDNYASRSIPQIESHDPLWRHPALRTEVEEGAHYLPGTGTGHRETVLTSSGDARPQQVLQLPNDSWVPFLAAAATAAFFMLLTLKAQVIASCCGLLAVALILFWLWKTDRRPQRQSVDIGGGFVLPVYVTGPDSHSRLSMLVLLTVLAVVYACLLFAYGYIWSGNPEAWPPSGRGLPEATGTWLAAAAWVASLIAFGLAHRCLPGRQSRTAFTLSMLLGLALTTAAYAFDLYGHMQAGLLPQEHAYDAIVASLLAYQGALWLVSAVMVLYLLLRSGCRLLDAIHSVSFDNCRLYWNYMAVQNLLSLAILTGLPRWLV